MQSFVLPKLILLNLFLIPVLTRAQLSPALNQYVDSIMNAEYKPGKPGAVLLIAKDGKPLFRKAYGLANAELNIPNSCDYIFPIASVSKQFTAICILQLAQGGKLSLQDDIRKYIPYYNSHGRIITIEHLLTNTSGIIDVTTKEWDPRSCFTQKPEDVVRSFMNDSLLFEPGTDWSYSSSNFILLGVVVEKVSGMSFYEYEQKNIFERAGMDHSTNAVVNIVIPGLVSAYRDDTTSLQNGVISYNCWTGMFSAGSIITTVDDLLKYDEALYTDKLLTSYWREKFWTPYKLKDGRITNYGCGITVQKVNGLNHISHGGLGDGYMSNIARLSSEHIFVAFLTNNGGHFPYVPANKIALAIAGKPFQNPSEGNLTAEQAAAYTGEYQVHRMGFICCFEVANQSSTKPLYRKVNFSGNHLSELGEGDKIKDLCYLGNDLFCFKDEPYRYIKFQRNKNGEINSLLRYDMVNYGPADIEEKVVSGKKSDLH